MLVLDTDHLAILQQGGPSAIRLRARLDASNQQVATTIITALESIQGWQAAINKHANDPRRQVQYYDSARRLLIFLSRWPLLAFDDTAAAKYDELRGLRLRSIGTNDLKIAAIVARHNATLLSANLRHFRLVPNLPVEDWLAGPPP